MGVTPIEKIDLSKEINDWKSAIYGRDVRNANTSALEKLQKIINGTVVNVNDAAEQIDEIKQLADTSSKNAAESAKNAKASETAAAKSAQNASNSETNAATSATNAASSASNASTSETNAVTSERNAAKSAQDALNSANAAEESATNAASSESTVTASAKAAATSESNAKASEEAAKTSETNAEAARKAAEKARDEASAFANLDNMSTTVNGIGRPDGDTITVDESGIFSLNDPDAETGIASKIKVPDYNDLVGSENVTLKDFLQAMCTRGSKDIKDANAAIEDTNTAINRQEHVTLITLTAAEWTGDAAPYEQTVAVEGVTAADNPMLVSALEDGADLATQKAYSKAFGILASGTGATADGSVTFKVYKKPATDLVAGLKGV